MGGGGVSLSVRASMFNVSVGVGVGLGLGSASAVAWTPARLAWRSSRGRCAPSSGCAWARREGEKGVRLSLVHPPCHDQNCDGH
jgi:hypothetical protein